MGLVFQCEDCRAFTTLKEASLICHHGRATPETAEWKIACITCSTEFVYWIDVGDLYRKVHYHGSGKDAWQLHGPDAWEEHLLGKRWFDPFKFWIAIGRLEELRARAAAEIPPTPSSKKSGRVATKVRRETEPPLPGAVRLEVRAFVHGEWGGTVDGWQESIKHVTAGVYALLHQGITLYVGQSTTVLSRLATHLSLRPFSVAYVLPCQPGDLDRVEREAIARLNPPWNTTHRTAGDPLPSFVLPPEAR